MSERALRVVGGALLFLAAGVAGCAAGEPGVGIRRDGGGLADGALDVGVRPDTGPPDAVVGFDAAFERLQFCETCVSNVECGATARCGELSDDTMACLPICNPDIPSCPRGFECVIDLGGGEMLDTPVCAPIGRLCCIDQDADSYGVGSQCAGPDCDDDDIDRHPDADETCNLEDDDCDTNVDEASSDCSGQHCDATTSGTYEAVPPSTCAAGECTDVGRTSCMLYTCNDGEDRGDFCATTCAEAGTGLDSDTYCIVTGHCDVGACELDYDNGETCDEDSDCDSAHCDNGFCCDDGICCGASGDCPGAGTVMPICEDTHTCQGTRGVISCIANQCQAPAGTPDDSGCDATLEADTCGPYRSVYCNAGTDQRVMCPTSCGSDSTCDDEAHCDAVCIPDAIDGSVCDEPSDCQSGHCNNNICCSGGDCCRTPSDCPASYGTPPVCDVPALCQGSRDAPTCASSVCATAMDVDDDSACIASTLASDCGLFPSRFCVGGSDQTPPACAGMCTADADCDGPAHCDAMNCVADVGDGSACDEDSDCAGAHCQNGFCCASGDCCSTAANCAVSTYATASVCNTPATCQGTRRDPVCSATSQCGIGAAVDDDSGCNTITSNACGLYPSIACTSAMTQPTDQMSLCSMSCVTSTNCDAGAYCMGGMCLPRGRTGDACTTTGQCDAGLTCADGVCCTTACGGTCRSCAVPGSLGTCSNVPSGNDPDSECGGVACSGYFHGYSSSTCYRRADAPAGSVSCDGAGSCQGPGAVCPSQGQGPAVSSCDTQCQSPSAGTCSGTTPGGCNNVAGSPATLNCGVGACAASIPHCAMGAPNTCVPGSPSTEMCNDVDDNCDGTVDNGAFTDSFEANNSCAASRLLSATITTTATGGGTTPSTTITPTIYGASDVDYFTVNWSETDSSCGACGGFLSTDEDYEVVWRLTVPPGAGSYTLCGEMSACGTMSNCTLISAGNSGTVVVGRDGGCDPFGSDSGNARARVTGTGAPAFECAAYTLTATVRMACGY